MGFDLGDFRFTVKTYFGAWEKPSRVTFSGNTTICFWPDGSKQIVRCKDGDEFDKEYAVAMCVAHHVFGSKNQFKKFVKAGYIEPTKEERKVIKDSKEARKLVYSDDE